MPWKIKPVAFLPRFLFSVRPCEGRHSSVTTGYLAKESGACRDPLEMGLESQQGCFKRLAVYSHDGACQWNISECTPVRAYGDIFFKYNFNLSSGAQPHAYQKSDFTPGTSNDRFSSICDTSIFTAVKKKKKQPNPHFLHIPSGMRLSLKWVYGLKNSHEAFAGR